KNDFCFGGLGHCGFSWADDCRGGMPPVSRHGVMLRTGAAAVKACSYWMLAQNYWPPPKTAAGLLCSWPIATDPGNVAHGPCRSCPLAAPGAHDRAAEGSCARRGLHPVAAGRRDLHAVGPPALMHPGA